MENLIPPNDSSDDESSNDSGTSCNTVVDLSLDLPTNVLDDYDFVSFDSPTNVLDDYDLSHIEEYIAERDSKLPDEAWLTPDIGKAKATASVVATTSSAVCVYHTNSALRGEPSPRKGSSSDLIDTTSEIKPTASCATVCERTTLQIMENPEISEPAETEEYNLPVEAPFELVAKSFLKLGTQDNEHNRTCSEASPKSIKQIKKCSQDIISRTRISRTAAGEIVTTFIHKKDDKNSKWYTVQTTNKMTKPSQKRK